MKRKRLVRRFKIVAVLLAASLCLSMSNQVTYAASEGSEETGSTDESATNLGFNDFFYSGADKLSEDPYHFDYASMQIDEEYRVGDFYCRGTILLAYLGNEENVVIPEGITCLGREDVLMDSAFGGTPVVSVTFPSTLKNAGHHTFYECAKLKTVKMNSGLEKIGSYCFYSSALEAVTIPESVTLVDARAFDSDKKLKTVNIMGKNTRFNQEVFSDTPFLKSLYNKDKVAIKDNYLLDAVKYKKAKFVVPSNVTSIAGGAFFLNESVEEIVMHDNVTLLGSEVFRSCENLKKIKMSKNLTNIPYWAFVKCNDLEEITIPKTVTSIESGAFYDTFITKVNFLSKTTNIEEDMFEETPWLSVQQDKSPFVVINGVLIDATKTSGKVVVPDTVHIINDEAFAGNEVVTDVVLPDSVVRIDEDAFWSCSNLKSVDMGNSVKEVASGAFRYCPKLTSVVFPDSVEKIGTYMFQESNSVKYVRLPAGLKRLEEYVLSETSINSIVIPGSVTYISGHAMSGLELTNYYLSSVLEDGSYIIGGANSSNIIVNYPQEPIYDWLNDYTGEAGRRIAQPSYALNDSKLTLYPTWYGKKLKLEDEFQRSVNTDVVWQSGNTSVATVTNGMVLPVSSGTTTITATYQNKTYTCSVTVKDPSLNMTKVTVGYYDDAFLSVLNAKSSDVKWSTSNKSVATISQKGMIEQHKDGSAIITATVGNKKYSCKVTVRY
jgi:hypothetical protein